jgi:hypothetical protein
MKWESLLALVGNEAVFPSALLLAGETGSLWHDCHGDPDHLSLRNLFLGM